MRIAAVGLVLLCGCQLSLDGTYAYMSSSHQIGTGAGQTSGVFVGGLVP